MPSYYCSSRADTNLSAGTWSGCGNTYCSNTAAGTTPNGLFYNTVTYSPPETPEQREDRERREAEYRAAQERQAEALRLALLEAEEAHRRADELLQQYLTEQELAVFQQQGHIHVDSRKYAGRKYRIPKDHTCYIEVLDEAGEVMDTLCIHSAVECPPSDHTLARLILLRHNEEYVLATANHHGRG